MLLAGFSQGGAMSLFTGLQLPKLEGRDSEHALAGLVVMSGYLPGLLPRLLQAVWCSQRS
jgi:lysophospholipase-2